MTDESTEEEAPQPLAKEEGDISSLQSWIQVGGFPAWPEEEAQGLLVEEGLPYPLFLLFMWLFFCSATPMFPFWSFFTGLGFAEVGQLIMQGGSQIGGESPALRNGRAS